MAKTKIEWTEYSWNPVTGCTPVSEGCKNCYAHRMANRTEAMLKKKLEFMQKNCALALERVAELLQERDRLKAELQTLKKSRH